MKLNVKVVGVTSVKSVQLNTLLMEESGGFAPFV